MIMTPRSLISLSISLLATGATCLAADNPAAWPCWRGPAGNGVSDERDWNPAALKDGAKVLWRTNVNTGYSSVAVRGDRLYTAGWRSGTGTVFCLNAQTGQQVWRHDYACKAVATEGTRGTPTLDDDSLYVLTERGLVLCLDAANGAVKWQRDLEEEKLAKTPFYGFSGSPAVYGDLLVLNAGLSGVALNKKTGETAWSSAAEKGGYATPVIGQIAGRDVALIFGKAAVCGVNPKDGKLWWSYPWDTTFDSSVADPIVLGDKVFVSTCYDKGGSQLDKGCALLNVAGETPRVEWENKNMRNHMNPCVVLAGHAYGFDLKDSSKKAALKCLDLATGEVKWSQGSGLFGTLMAADGKLIMLAQEGNLVIAEATPAGYKELSRADGVLPKKCWTVPVLCGGRIYCRNDQGDLVCVDVSK
jgi:outer membrane protein assembly factor BamB